MRIDSVVMHEGKEYVSISEFAFRVGSTYQMIRKYIGDGFLIATDVQKNGNKYLEWQTQNVAYRITKQKKAAKGGSGHKKKKVVSPIMKEKSIKDPSVSVPTLKLEDNTMQEITISDTVIDLSNINPYEHKDCWIMVDGEPATDPDGRPRLDYELLKTKVTVQTYQLKLGKEKGTLIPKQELLPTLQAAGNVFRSQIANIPNRFASALIAVVSSLKNVEFDAQEKTQIMNTLRNVPKEISISVQDALDKIGEDDEAEI